MKLINDHPAIFSWLALSTGMVAIILYEARGKGLEGSQWFWLIVITVLVAALCVWIISWGDDEEESDA